MKTGVPTANLVVVTGGAGYIGSLLVRQLLETGTPVRIFDRMLYGDDAISQVLDHPLCDMVVGDFRNPEKVTVALQGASAVIHLGAIVGDPACAVDEDLALTTNVTGAAIVADACIEQGVARMIFASTCSVYGASNRPLDETSALHPLSLYANTKVAAEKAVLSRRRKGFAPVVLRFGTAFGTSYRERFDLVVNLLTAKAVRDGQITIFGGDQWRPFIHVFDIARAVRMALKVPIESVSGQVINVGVDSLNYRLHEVGAIIQQLVPHSSVITCDQVTDNRNYYVHFAKAIALLGFSPTRTLQDGVKELAEILSTGQINSYHDAKYHNVLQLSVDTQLMPNRSASVSSGSLETVLAKPVFHQSRYDAPVVLDDGNRNAGT